MYESCTESTVSSTMLNSSLVVKRSSSDVSLGRASTTILVYRSSIVVVGVVVDIDWEECGGFDETEGDAVGWIVLDVLLLMPCSDEADVENVDEEAEDDECDVDVDRDDNFAAFCDAFNLKSRSCSNSSGVIAYEKPSPCFAGSYGAAGYPSRLGGPAAAGIGNEYI